MPTESSPAVAERAAKITNHYIATQHFPDDINVKFPSRIRPPSLLEIIRHNGQHVMPDSEDEDTAIDQVEEDTSSSTQLNKDLWGWGLCLRLENAGIVARDHLALERTFLAYLRTSLALTSAGVALAQAMCIPSVSDDHRNDLSEPSLGYRDPAAVLGRRLGVTAICMGLAILATGVVRFFSVQRMLVKGRFPVAQHNIIGVTTAFSVVMLCMLWFLHG